MYLSKWLNLFVRIAKLICQNFQMDLSKFPNDFGKISNWICQNFEMVLSKFSNGFVWIADCICPNYTAKQRESREGRMEGWSEAAPGVAPTSFPLSLSAQPAQYPPSSPTKLGQEYFSQFWANCVEAKDDTVFSAYCSKSVLFQWKWFSLSL